MVASKIRKKIKSNRYTRRMVRRTRRNMKGGGKKRVALLFWGRISSYEHSLEYIKSIYNNPDFTCVVFCSLNMSKKNKYVNGFCKEFDIKDEQINIEPTRVPESYGKNPKNKELCHGGERIASIRDGICYNTYSLFYHQNKAFNLMEAYSDNHSMNFDIVVVFRADMNAENEPNVFPITRRIEANTVYIPKKSYGMNDIGDNGRAIKHASNYYDNGITTLAAYGDFESMKKYCSLVEKNIDVFDNPEIMLLDHLKDMELDIRRFTHDIRLNPERFDNYD